MHVLNANTSLSVLKVLMGFLALVRMTLKMRGVMFAVAVKVLKVLEVCILVKHLTVYMHALNMYVFLY